MSSIVKSRRAIAALMIVIVISLFLISLSILMAVQGNLSISSDQLEGQANKAQFLAETGIQDALIKISRDKDFAGSYTLTESPGTVDIAVTSGSPVLVDATSTVVQGAATVRRTIHADVTLDADGKILTITKANR